MTQFKCEESDGVHLIVCPSSIDGKESSGLEGQFKAWLLATSNIHVMDFKATVVLEPSAYRPFVLFNQSLKNNGKSLFVVNVSPKIHAQLKQDGLTSVFNVVASVAEAKRKAAAGKVVLDVNFVNPFVDATKMVLEMQAQTQLTPGKPYLKRPGENLPTEIAGVISLISSDFRGSITVCFEAKVFLKIYENMVGEKHETITPEVEDAAGELLNIIFGQAKTVLNDKKGFSLEKALPTVLVGDRLKIHHQSRNPAIVLPFDSSAGSFHLEVLIDQG